MHERVKIITDSTADLPADIVTRYNIEVLPMHIIIDGVNKHDKDVDIERIYPIVESAQSKENIPITHSPTIEEVKDAYMRARDEGYTHIISIHISSKLSRLCSNAEKAAEQVPGIIVNVVDSQYASVALGLLVFRAADEVSNGMPVTELMSNMPKYIRSMRFLIKIKTLKLLEISGRLGLLRMYKNRDTTGEGMIITMRGGILVPFEIIPKKKIASRVLAMIKAAYKPNSSIYLAYGSNAGLAKEYMPLISQIRKKYKIISYFETETGHINLIHVGPESWAVAYFK